ncbi:hypothetical protein PQX77_011674 [Marasmius sp. AFHP31]|nr:hypothetical protein PQX77_011674 [Marasmius sp. AFHP31]
MYSPHRRTRPWSPDPNDPLPTVSRHHIPNETSYDFDFEYSRYPQSDHSHSNPNPTQSRNQRREPSDVSVEALDLADYARTLQRNQHPPQRERGHVPDNMLDSLHPPSLTYSSASDASSSRNSRRSHRPFSLPPSSPRNHSYQSFSNPRHQQQQQHEPDFLAHEDEEIDIARFPAWSRSWYNNRNNPSSPPDIYSPLPQSQFDSVKYKARHKSNIFDPGNTWDRDRDPYSTHNTRNSYSYTPNYYNDPPPTSSFSHESTRDLLPWNHDSRDHPLDPALKEERMRMLEREFGPNAQSSHQRNQDPNSPFLLDENGKPLIGTVSQSGYIVTQGPRKRLFFRVLEVLLAAVAAIPAIYAAVSIKFTDEEVKKEGSPPPQGTAQTYVLYVMSALWLVGLVVLFVFYPCCCGRRRKVKKDGMMDGMGMGPGGMMVMPVIQGLGGGKNGKKKGKGGKKKNKGGPGPPGDVQVNLIVDPTMFRGQEEEDPSDEDNTYDEFGERGSSASMPGGYGGSGGPRKKRKAKRRSVFVGLQMEEDWKKARSFMKKVTAVDVFGVVVWGAVFIFILLGKRCPTGGFKGWCNAYNTSSAAACLLCVAFGVSVFFDIKDLHASKESPRTRT